MIVPFERVAVRVVLELIGRLDVATVRSMITTELEVEAMYLPTEIGEHLPEPRLPLLGSPMLAAAVRGKQCEPQDVLLAALLLRLEMSFLLEVVVLLVALALLLEVIVLLVALALLLEKGRLLEFAVEETLLVEMALLLEVVVPVEMTLLLGVVVLLIALVLELPLRMPLSPSGYSLHPQDPAVICLESSERVARMVRSLPLTYQYPRLFMHHRLPVKIPARESLGLLGAWVEQYNCPSTKEKVVCFCKLASRKSATRTIVEPERRTLLQPS